MRKIAAIAAIVFGASVFSLSSSASARAVSPGHHKSWGMAGVSLEQYAADSAECAVAAASMDLSDTAPAQALILASRMYDTWWNPHYNPLNGIPGIARTAPPEIEWSRAATIMENELEGCLTARGYVKFELTDDQYRTLKMYEVGTPERRRYLHGLASDAEVLAAQGLAES